jgi:hypothetical protein
MYWESILISVLLRGRSLISLTNRLKACLNEATIVLEAQAKTSPASTTTEQDHLHHLHPLLQLPKVVMDLETPINMEEICRQTEDTSKTFHQE